MVFFNPLNKFYKSHIGAVPENTEITIRVKGEFDSVVLLIKKDGESDSFYPLTKTEDYFQCVVSLSVGLYFYCFSINGSTFLGLGKDYTGVLTDTPERFQLTVYNKNYTTPDWIKGGVIYQIFPDRFYSANKNKTVDCDKILHEKWSDLPVFEPNEFGQVVNNDFFGGDLLGITEKLPYLKDLGVTVIYLNPIFKAFSNHRYDTGDYMTIDPLLGCEKDLVNLIEKAAENGIKIVLDGVFNHTGDDSLYFNKYGKYPSVGAYQSKNSKYYGWYNFTDFPREYESWWGIKVLPSVNENNSDFVEFITGDGGVIDHYTKLGVGGWRLDVVDELPTDFVRRIRTAVKTANPNAVVIGEVWEDASNKISYGIRREYFQGKELDSVMNYPLKNAILNYVNFGDVKALSYVVKEQIDHYPKCVLDSLMNILSTHDTCRLLSVLGGENVQGKSKKQMSETFIPEDKLPEAKQKLKIASLLQFTLCGVPSLYYGDEIGMQGYVDPLNRKTYPWGNEDAELLYWYKFLGKLRADYSAFTNGEYCEIYADGGAFVYKRFDQNSELLIAVNVGDCEVIIDYDEELTELFSGEKFSNSFTLAPTSFAVLVNKN